MKPAKLHVFPASPNARKVMLANHLTGLNIPYQMVNLQEGEQQAEAFLALNPNGKIPVLEFDDGSSLWESNVIVNRLATEAESDLWPRSNIRYDILRWQFWEACHWTPACTKYVSKHLFKNEGVDLDAAAIDFARYAKVLEGHLAGRDWLVGDAMTTADITLSPIFYLREMCQYPLDGYANIAAWVARVEALDAWGATDPAAQAA